MFKSISKISITVLIFAGFLHADVPSGVTGIVSNQSGGGFDFNSLKNFPIAFPSISNSMLYLGVSFRTTLEKHHFLPPFLTKSLFFTLFLTNIPFLYNKIYNKKALWVAQKQPYNLHFRPRVLKFAR